VHYIFPDLIAAGVEGVAVVPVYFLWQRFSNLSTSVSWLQLPAALGTGASTHWRVCCRGKGAQAVAFSDAFAVPGGGAGLFCWGLVCFAEEIKVRVSSPCNH